ncbi:MAG TPA: guanylate kinase [Acidimicrobiia bacterium]|nr:guanylate kinase [Acidimicrobiia bacterium]
MISGPSGTGKGTIVRRLLEREPRLWFSVSANTRPPREGEVDGRDYRFMSRDEFRALEAAGGFLESFQVYDDLKGTPRAPVEEHLAAGDDVLLELDVQGALAVREAYPDAVLVFVKPPSREVQRERLLARDATADPEVLARRLAKADAEEALADRFDAVVVNDDLDRAVREVAAILEARRSAG